MLANVHFLMQDAKHGNEVSVKAVIDDVLTYMESAEIRADRVTLTAQARIHA